MTQTQIDIVQQLGPWFHNLHLPDGTQTRPDHYFGDFPSFKWQALKPVIPDDLTGWTALDIGCNAGFYSIELARRGAQVLAIDHDDHYLRQARWAVEQYDLAGRIELAKMEVYDLPALGRRFDLILFMGVFYHLRYPLLALDLVADCVDRLLVFQTLTMPGEEVMQVAADYPVNDRDHMLEPGYPKMAFIEHRIGDDPTNWWAPNRACVEAMLRSANLRILEQPMEETYVCQPTPGHRAIGRLSRPPRAMARGT